MDKGLKKLLILPLRGRWARVGLTALLSAVVTVGAMAQTGGEDGMQPPRDLNSELRTRTWSIYAQGGVSWATDVWYQNIDAKKSYKIAPALGGGVDFTIRPWVRVGAEYLWSRYRREQRISALSTTTMPIKAYGNYMMNYHNIKLGGDFNVMELWPNRGAQWLNIWAGTGLGYSIGRGNEYGMYFSNTKTQGGVTTPFVNGESISNAGTITITGNVLTSNRHERFNRIYIPASLHVETDLSRRLTLGVKGEIDWLMNRKEVAPKNHIFALVTVRYNLVSSRAKVVRNYYEGEISTLNGQLDELRREAAQAQAKADKAENARADAEKKNAELQRRLSDCDQAKKAALEEAQASKLVPFTYYVQFDNNSSVISRAEAERLKVFAQNAKGHTLSIVAEASAAGPENYNQWISERRLQKVVKALVDGGCAEADMHPTTAIGEKNGKTKAEGRRVTIVIEK